jgi:uncharacterized phiE125 gp8 family phage protein
MLSLDPLGLDSVMLAEVRAYVRVDAGTDDNVLATCAVAAIEHAEQFTRQILIRRGAKDMVTTGSGWQILQAMPVQSIEGVTGIPAECGGIAYRWPISQLGQSTGVTSAWLAAVDGIFLQQPRCER